MIMIKIPASLQQRDYLIPVLGLCPMLVAVNNLQTGLAMGVICLIAITIISGLYAVTRQLWPAELHLVVVVLISACVISMLQLLIQLWFYEISQQLGIYIYLLAMNCIVLALAEDAAKAESATSFTAQTALTGLVILVILPGIGLIREYGELSLLKQPFGVFFILALLLALDRIIRGRLKAV